MNKAGLNRSTFYAHFDCPADVHKLLEQRLVDDMLEDLNGLSLRGIMENPKPLFDKVAERLESRTDYMKLLFGNTPAVHWMESMRDALIDKLMSDEEGVSLYENKDDLYIILRMYTGGYIEICRDYLMGRISLKPSEFSSLFARTVAGGMMAGMNK